MIPAVARPFPAREGSLRMRAFARCPQMIPGMLPMPKPSEDTNETNASVESFPEPGWIGAAGASEAPGVAARLAGEGTVNVFWQAGQVIYLLWYKVSPEILWPQWGQANRNSLMDFLPSLFSRRASRP